MNPIELINLVNKTADLLDDLKSQDAKILCQEIIKEAPDCAEAWSNLSFAELQMNNTSGAKDAAKKALAISPDNAKTWHNLGEAHLREGDPENALKFNNRALTLEDHHYLIWYGKATSLMALERYQDAVHSFNKALELNPNFESAIISKEVALLLGNEGTKKCFKEIWEIALEYTKENADDNELKNKLIMFTVLNNDHFSKSLLVSFDYYVLLNLRLSNKYIIFFSYCNYLLAIILNDEEIVKRTHSRFLEVKNQLSKQSNN